jgi:hypothetical protein
MNRELSDRLRGAGRRWRDEQPPLPSLDTTIARATAPQRSAPRHRWQPGWATVGAVAAAAIPVIAIGLLFLGWPLGTDGGQSRGTSPGVSASASAQPTHAGGTGPGTPIGCGTQPANARIVGIIATVTASAASHDWILTLTNTSADPQHLAEDFDLDALDQHGTIIGHRAFDNLNVPRSLILQPGDSWSTHIVPVANDCSVHARGSTTPAVPAGTYPFAATLRVGTNYLLSDTTSITVTADGRFMAG